MDIRLLPFRRSDRKCFYLAASIRIGLRDGGMGMPGRGRGSGELQPDGWESGKSCEKRSESTKLWHDAGRRKVSKKRSESTRPQHSGDSGKFRERRSESWERSIPLRKRRPGTSRGVLRTSARRESNPERKCLKPIVLSQYLKFVTGFVTRFHFKIRSIRSARSFFAASERFF